MECLKILKEIGEAISDFTSTIEALKKETDDFISNVRNEIKKYEP